MTFERHGKTWEAFLGDDGSMDTLIIIEANGMARKTYRFDCEYAAQFRDSRGRMTDKGFKELVEETLDEMSPEDFEVTMPSDEFLRIQAQEALEKRKRESQRIRRMAGVSKTAWGNPKSVWAKLGDRCVSCGHPRSFHLGPQSECWHQGCFSPFIGGTGATRCGGFAEPYGVVGESGKFIPHDPAENPTPRRSEKVYPIEVRLYKEGTTHYSMKPVYKVIEVIHRKIWVEQIGNFSPFFCEYKGKRTPIHSDSGDLSDPFRREEDYAKTFFIEIEHQPKTGAKCSCRPGQDRDNCPACEGTGMRIDFKRIRENPKKLTAADRAREAMNLAKLPEECFSTSQMTGEPIGIVRGQMGYRPIREIGGGLNVQQANALLNVSPAQEAAMVAGSMFGWHTMAANPDNYNDDGTMKRDFASNPFFSRKALRDEYLSLKKKHGASEGDRRLAMLMGLEDPHVLAPEKLGANDCYICGHHRKFHSAKKCGFKRKVKGGNVICGIGPHKFITWKERRDNPLYKGGMNVKARTARLHPAKPHMKPYTHGKHRVPCDCGGMPEPLSSAAESHFKKRMKKILDNPGRTLVGRKCLEVKMSGGCVEGHLGSIYGLHDGSVFIKGLVTKLPGGRVKNVVYLDEAKAEREGLSPADRPWKHDFSSHDVIVLRVKGGVLLKSKKGSHLWENR